jgi:hypothetical protein
MHSIDFSKSLQQLDGQDWGEPTYPSHLVTECHRLRRVPIDRMTGGDLRRLIGQRIGLEYLVPRALELLANDPLLDEGYELYPGDVLFNLLRISADFWEAHPGWRREMVAIAAAARARCDEINTQAETDWQVLPADPYDVRAINQFLARYGDGCRQSHA